MTASEPFAEAPIAPTGVQWGWHLRQLAAWGATAILFGLCLWPKGWMPVREEAPKPIPHLDKVAHFGMFATFALAWAGAALPEARSNRRSWRIFAVAVTLALATEGAQGLPIISRDPDALDCSADIAGAAAGLGVAAIVFPRRPEPSVA